MRVAYVSAPCVEAEQVIVGNQCLVYWDSDLDWGEDGPNLSNLADHLADILGRSPLEVVYITDRSELPEYWDHDDLLALALAKLDAART